ncbi:MAG: carbohydrate ABC transporter permease [Clostridia bacterium]|nr:carbohydrate ABC transporter permease [Clostridia bacterium]
MISSFRKKNISALIVCILTAVLTVLILFLPCYTFHTDLYTKKSGNTFVGDEKYLSVKAEVEAVADEYRAMGFVIELKESVTERVNSKGEKTSMVAFTLQQEEQRNALCFLNTVFPSSKLMALLLISIGLALIFALAGSLRSVSADTNALDRTSRIFRSASGWCVLAAIVLVFLFAMSNTYSLSRKITLYKNGLSDAGMDAFYAGIDAFVFNGTAGDKVQELASGFTFDLLPGYWITVPLLFMMLLSVILLRRGALKKTLSRGLLYLFILIVCVVTLYPYYVMFITGFRSNAETTDMYFQNVLPVRWVFSNLKDIIDRGVLRFLGNSILISFGATGIAMLCGIPAAYALSRMRFKGRKAFLGFVIMSQMFSPVVLLIGISQLMNTLHLNDTLLGLMLINAAFNQAFAIWLLRGTFSAISPEMEQAAYIDGCGRIGSLIRILLPMAAPGIVTTLIFIFINAWNEYTISTVLISTPDLRPVTVGITQFSSFNMIEWQYLFSASLLATIPVVILFICIEKHLVSGLTAGGVKG